MSNDLHSKSARTIAVSGPNSATRSGLSQAQFEKGRRTRWSSMASDGDLRARVDPPPPGLRPRAAPFGRLSSPEALTAGRLALRWSRLPPCAWLDGAGICAQENNHVARPNERRSGSQRLHRRGRRRSRRQEVFQLVEIVPLRFADARTSGSHPPAYRRLPVPTGTLPAQPHRTFPNPCSRASCQAPPHPSPPARTWFAALLNGELAQGPTNPSEPKMRPRGTRFWKAKPGIRAFCQKGAGLRQK